MFDYFSKNVNKTFFTVHLFNVITLLKSKIINMNKAISRNADLAKNEYLS